MEKINNHKEAGAGEDNIDKKMSRRRFLKIMGAAGAAGLCPGVAKEALSYWDDPVDKNFPYKEKWNYSLAEMGRVYEKEYNAEEKILAEAIEREGDVWVARVDGKKVAVPREFIDRTLAHLKEMIERGAARYLFRLDAYHGHFFVDKERKKSVYAGLDRVEAARALVKDNDLGVLYHNAEHLRESHPEVREEEELIRKRNVLGWHDGRGIKILDLPEGKSTAAPTPGGCADIGPLFRFAAHKNGNFSLEVNGREIRLDFSFGDADYI